MTDIWRDKHQGQFSLRNLDLDDFSCRRRNFVHRHLIPFVAHELNKGRGVSNFAQIGNLTLETCDVYTFSVARQ